ncbi:MAG: hypothetical protein FJ318_00565 [SAR202 cluster bacterium]|nr:hypothetical protein [SAR202 cluster bacterium]
MNDPNMRRYWWLEQRLPRIACPTLVTWGSDDPVMTSDFGRQAVSLLPNGRLHVFEDGTHNPHAVALEKYAALLAEFLA